ncbi:MAG: CYTH domain-containing protein [Sedimentitalea sp.]|uniref:CYTH domain-containing protein n=1 Tax=Sedimentitalea sp. TaxID=2048915 RepID=UPI0032644038
MSTGTEVERKFLVASLPDLGQARAVQIRQGYLTSKQDTVEIRLRQKGDTYLTTLKKGAGLERIECEAEISQDHFDLFWPATEGRRVEKTRWTGTLESGSVFELDIFDGRLAPLTLVEVEFDNVAGAAAFQPPPWFGRDVTDDARYSNASLAAAGPPADGE